MLILKDVENILEKGGFEYCRYGGCFDLAATRDFTMFIKILGNVDSLQESQARNLKVLSKDFDATVAIIGTHTRRENLDDNIVYDRFEIPTFTPATLENIVINDMFPFLYRFRGGMFAEINPQKLRTQRENAGMTQQELADKVGISKKNVYEHEHAHKKVMHTTVVRIERLIGNVTDPICIRSDFSHVTNGGLQGFEKIVYNDFKRLGFHADAVSQTPFNIVAKNQSILIVSRADESAKRMQKDVPHIRAFSELMDLPAVAVTKEKMDLDIPTIKEEDLREIRHAKELRKMLK